MKNNQNPQTFHFDVKEVGDHLAVYIHELDSTVETEPGKVSDSDAFDAAHLAIEQASLNMDTLPEHKVSA